MNLRQRTLLSLGATLVGLTAVVYACSHHFLLESFQSLETEDIQKSVKQASNALAQEISQVHGLSGDWSDWDDTYKFIKDKNQAYIDANLSVVSLKVDILLFLDTDGKMVYFRGVPRRKGIAPPDPVNVRHALGFDRARTAWPAKPNGVCGVINLPRGPLLVSVRPIRPTSQKGPIRGWLVFGLRLDAEAAKELGETTQLDVSIFDPKDKRLSHDCQLAIAGLSLSERNNTQILGQNEVAGYALVRDLFGHPIQLLRVKSRRGIYNQGSRTVGFVVRLLVLGAICFGLVILALVETSVLRRLFDLSRQVESVGEGDDGGGHVVLCGRDELSKLASRINQMLERMRDSREQLRNKNESLKLAVDELATINVALENAVEGIARLDNSGAIVSVNSAFARIFGLEQESLIGQTWREVLPNTAQAKFEKAITAMESTGRSETELECRRPCGTSFFAESVFLPFIDEHGAQQGHYWFVKDISDRKRLEVEIQHQAFHDALTGLPNRLLFLDRLGHALLRAQRHNGGVAVIYIDLDNFKVINDSLGHEAGDNLLTAVSSVLWSCVRPEDTVARLGGDEFTILLSGLQSKSEAIEVAERVLEALSRPVLLKSGVAFAAASLGVTYSADGNTSSDDMLRDADTAMYKAKNFGKGAYVVFDPSMNVQAVERLELEAGLRRAIENHEFYLTYQPIVDLGNGSVCGMEALIRWEHPDRGIVSPEQFIPVAEETGLIGVIGAWALEEACHQAKAWNDEFGTDLMISVNLSGRQLLRADIVEAVADVLDRTGLQARLLKLEITESVLMRDTVGIADKLHQLKELGVLLAIDDFGTGYSSMSSLSSFPIDTVKIDRTFVEQIGENVNSEAIIAAIVSLSKTMEFDVTAEGIERVTQLRQARNLGCTAAQGYLFSMPLPAQEFESKLRDGSMAEKILAENAA